MLKNKSGNVNHINIYSIINVLFAIFSGKYARINSVSALLACMISSFISLFYVFYSIHKKLIPKRLYNCYIEILSTVLLSFIVLLILGVIDSNLFQARYLYPIFALYYFFVVTIFLQVLLSHKSYIKLPIIISLIVIDLFTIKSSLITYKTDIVSCNIIRMTKHPKYYFNCKNGESKTGLVVQYSIYLQGNNNKIITKHVNMPAILGDNNKKLFNDVFKNIYLRNN